MAEQLGEQWVVFDAKTNEPIRVSKDVGTYIPVWTEPISAHQWANSFGTKITYYVREVEMLYLAKRE